MSNTDRADYINRLPKRDLVEYIDDGIGPQRSDDEMRDARLALDALARMVPAAPPRLSSIKQRLAAATRRDAPLIAHAPEDLAWCVERIDALARGYRDDNGACRWCGVGRECFHDDECPVAVLEAQR